VIHHPVQCAEPELSFVSDDDVELARATRRALLATAADTATLVIGTHFPTAPGGRVVSNGGAWRFDPQAGRT
jgi:hypothetical protein